MRALIIYINDSLRTLLSVSTAFKTGFPIIISNVEWKFLASNEVTVKDIAGITFLVTSLQ